MRIHLFSCLLLFQIFSGLGVSGQCLNDQRSLLLELKNNLVFGSSSTKLVNWNQSSSDCCNWDGIGCDDSGSGRVTSLDLSNELIYSGIDNSTALFSLQNLRELNLAVNVFNDIQIPKGLQNLTNLEYLNLSNAGFGGQVPIELSALINLEVLDLSSQFQGLVPLKLENPNLKTLVQNLKGLRELYLDGVNISDSDWGQALSSSLPNLRNLSLRRCDISGPLDNSLSELHSLSVLQLDNNNLNTTFPEFFANFSSLSVLTLSFCHLQGFFPDKIFQVPTLQKLDLDNNWLLSGSISEFHHNGSFRSIVLSYTNFSGSLPDSISNLTKLTMIDLSNCKFTGQIPSTIANLTELVHLDFSFNSFTGSIPLFHMSKKITYIDLSRNFLTGSLSSQHFEGLSNLVFINLGSNSLNGSIPQSLFGLPSLQKLLLANNKFSARVSEFSTQNSSNLDTIDLSSNDLEGSIPKSFFELKQLNVLSLSFNFFNGTVNLEKIRLGNLTRLELGYNNLTVNANSSDSSLSLYPQLSRLNLASCNLYNFPDMRNQSRLVFLDLSNNHIKGEIPSWIWQIGNGTLLHLNLSSNLLQNVQTPYTISSSLGVLDLHSNELKGEFPMPPQSAIYVDYSSNKFDSAIPLGIGTSISFASFFSLANNSFTGKIPESLCFATYLQVLDLSGNNLNGSIPSCLVENIPNLGVLNLGGNNLDGGIADKFSVNCGMKTLDLSRNDLTGKIPKSLSNCKSLEVINVGNNKIDDGFPCILKNLSSLRVLVLRSNIFHGDIRCHDGVEHGWPNLQIIDIASNNFSGQLYPKCISSWRGMTLGNNDPQLRRNHLGFEFLGLNNFYYKDTVRVTIKGLELELVKILTVFTAIDFSLNNFSGVIPEEIGGLSSLYVLNLSHNGLTGSIPRSIGNLSQLGSLDLSANQLTGEIPQELTNLTFLAFLNLSFNKLVGQIPMGSQFQTYSAESYAGNARLCGFPLNTTCTRNETAGKPVLKKGFDWQFIFTGLGYGVGAALVMAPLAFCKTWREKCDKHLDQLLTMIYPRYGFSYVRYDSKVEAVEDIEEEMTDDDEDGEDDYEDNEGDELSCGSYCLYCTKLDIQMKKVKHNPKCTCHCSPPTFSSSHTSSSSSSLLVIYPKDF